jgi:hypothetical protein
MQIVALIVGVLATLHEYAPSLGSQIRGKVLIRTIRPMQKRQTVQVQQGRMNFTTLAVLLEGALVMSGAFSIHNKRAIILFDSGASHSFISAKFGAKLGLGFCHTKGSYMRSTPGGKIASNQIIRHVSIKLCSKTIKTDLILLALEGMDIILGMNWMALHEVTLDIFSELWK